MDNRELNHHGILGMKWGVRRTPAQLGHKPAGNRKTKAEERAASKIAKAEAKYLPKKKSGSENQAKSISEMSDAEIRDRINRIRMENELKSLSPQQVSKGKRFVSSVMNDVIGPAARDAGKRLATDFLQKKGAELLGLNKKDVADTATKLKNEVEYLSNIKKKGELEKYFEREKAKATEAATAEAEAKKQEKREAKEAKKQAREERRERRHQEREMTDEYYEQATREREAERQSQREERRGSNGSSTDTRSVSTAVSNAVGRQSDNSHQSRPVDISQYVTVRELSSNNRGWVDEGSNFVNDILSGTNWRRG